MSAGIRLDCRLTESQLTAGNLCLLAALISIVLVVVIGEVIPLSRPVEIETRVFVVLMAPLVVTLVGMGAWVVSRDEFGRLLLYGGQAAVHPRKLQWETNNGWTSVQGRGITSIPMFGEVRYVSIGVVDTIGSRGASHALFFRPAASNRLRKNRKVVSNYLCAVRAIRMKRTKRRWNSTLTNLVVILT